MKPIQSLLATTLLCSVTANAQTTALSSIVGHWTEPKAQEMGLYHIKNSELHEIARSKVINGRFAFAFYPEEEGYYAIAQRPQAASYRYTFYFKPGDCLSFEINGDDYTLTETDGINNTPENKAIAQWQDLVHPLEAKAIYFMGGNISTFRDFFPQLEQMLPQIEAFPKADTPNARFNASFENYKKFDMRQITSMFLNTPRTEHPKAGDYIDYYRHDPLPELTTSTAILDYPGGVDLIGRCYRNLLRTDTNLPAEELSKRMRNMDDYLLSSKAIANDTVRGEFMLAGTETIRTYPGIMEYKQKYGNLLVTEDQQKRFRDIVAKYDDNSEGHEAIDFRFQDVNGKQVALSDFKGKVVYVDVWATWCGPCKGEIPHLIKLEEAYHDNPNIVFMSVSVDKSKDIDKWKQMLKDKGMGGVQLFAGDRSDEIMKPYKITGIPRFMLFDKEGKVVNADAPRPSSGEIKALLDATLKK